MNFLIKIYETKDERTKKLWHASCSGGTHSLSSGTDVRLLLFCTMLAWFLRDMRRVEGARRHGSPSTCTGSVLKVVRTTSLHWCSRSPWPPTCSAALRWRRETRVSHEPLTLHSLSHRKSWGTHQRGHGEADHLDAAVVVPLRLEVSVVARVTPRHGTRTVPTDTRLTDTPDHMCKALLKIKAEWILQVKTGINVKPSDSKETCHLSSHYLLLI